MLFSKVLLCAAAVGVHGLTIWQPEQDAVNVNDAGPGMRITVQSEATIRRPPESATVSLRFTARGSSEETDLSEATKLLANTQLFLEQLAKQPASPLESFNITNIRWPDPKASRHRDSYSYGYGYGYDDDDFIFSEFEVRDKVTARFSLRFLQLDAIQGVIDELQTLAKIEPRHITWEVSEETRAAMKKEVKPEAIKKARATAEEYAEIFDVTVGRVLAVEEMFSFLDRDAKSYLFLDDSDGFDLTPREVEASTEVKCDFFAV